MCFYRLWPKTFFWFLRSVPHFRILKGIWKSDNYDIMKVPSTIFVITQKTL